MIFVKLDRYTLMYVQVVHAFFIVQDYRNKSYRGEAMVPYDGLQDAVALEHLQELLLSPRLLTKKKKINKKNNVADPHNFFTDLDPDPTFYFYVDPDLDRDPGF